MKSCSNVLALGFSIASILSFSGCPMNNDKDAVGNLCSAEYAQSFRAVYEAGESQHGEEVTAGVVAKRLEIACPGLMDIAAPTENCNVIVQAAGKRFVVGALDPAGQMGPSGDVVDEGETIDSSLRGQCSGALPTEEATAQTPSPSADPMTPPPSPAPIVRE